MQDSKWNPALLALLFGFACAPAKETRSLADGPPSSERYTFLMAGRPSGAMTLDHAVDGTRRIHFEFNDRGRGPSIDEEIAFGPDRLPLHSSVRGHDYLKTPVDETLARTSERSRWKSAAEAGERSAPGFYLALNGTPEELAALARAGMSHPDLPVPLLPSGEARVRRTRVEHVTSAGQSLQVALLEVTGLDLEPVPVWLDDRGELFAQGSLWGLVIRSGWEAVAQRLIDVQRESERTRRTDQATRLARRPTGTLVFRGVNVVDVRGGRVLPKTSVVVRGDLISAIGPDAKISVAPGAEVVDGHGKTLLPGLWDMHAHLNDAAGLLDLAAGVTTVRDLGNDVDESLVRQKEFRGGTLLGPEVLLAGLVDGPGPLAGPTKLLVSTPEDAERIVTDLAAKGYVQLKIYSSVKPELVPVLAAAAHRHGLRVSGHVPAFMTAEQAVRAGYDEIQHVNFLFLNFFLDVQDTRGPARFTAVAERAGSLDLSSPPVQHLIALLKAKGTVIDPTLNAFETLFVARPGVVDPGFASIADRLPSQFRRGLLTGGLPVPTGKDETYRSSFAATLKMVKRLHEAGVPIVAGTDSLPGFGLQRELELDVEAGLTPMEVLRIATLGAAEVMHRDGTVGSIEVGKRADLLLVDGDPTRSISDVRRPAMVVKGGAIYDPRAMLRELGISSP